MKRSTLAHSRPPLSSRGSRSPSTAIAKTKRPSMTITAAAHAAGIVARRPGQTKPTGRRDRDQSPAAKQSGRPQRGRASFTPGSGERQRAAPTPPIALARRSILGARKSEDRDSPSRQRRGASARRCASPLPSIISLRRGPSRRGSRNPASPPQHIQRFGDRRASAPIRHRRVSRGAKKHQKHRTCQTCGLRQRRARTLKMDFDPA